MVADPAYAASAPAAGSRAASACLTHALQPLRGSCKPSARAHPYSVQAV